MDVGIFTYITGIATLLGLLIQLTDIFPHHREARKSLVLIVVGLFAGTLIGTFQKISVTLAFPLTGLYVLVGAIIAVVFVLLIAATLTSDKEKRNQLFRASGVGTLLLFLILFGQLMLTSPAATSRSFDRISNDELLTLSKSSEEKGNIERSIYLLDIVLKGVSSNDPRHRILQERIADLKNRQIELGSK